MAKLVVLYQDGRFEPISGDANGDVLSWNATTSEWEPSSAGAGTVTSVATGTGLTGGPITTSGTISLAALDPAPTGSFGSASSVSAVTVDTYGRVTAASSTSIQIAQSQVTSLVTDLGNKADKTTTISAGTGLSGGGDLSANRTLSLANTAVTAASYGTTAAKTVSFTVDAQGRLTAASEANIAIAASAITSGTLGIERGGTGLSSAGGVANRVLLTTDGSAFSVGTVPNTALANSSLTVTAGTGLSGGGSVSLGGSTTLSLPNVGTASTYGSASSVPVITTDAQGRVSSVTNTSIAISASAVSAIPYDFGGSASGTPTAGADIFRFVFVRAASILASGSRCNCKTAPSGGSPSFDLKLNGASIGSIAFTDGNTTGTVTITSGPVAVAAGDTVVVTAPAALYSISDPCWTIAANVA